MDLYPHNRIRGTKYGTVSITNVALRGPEMRKELSCPICKKPKLKRLSNHLDNVHKVAGSEKAQLLREARENYVYSSPILFMDFFLSLKKIPLTYREYKMLSRYNKFVEAAWNSKSIRDLPTSLIKTLKDAHERFVLVEGHG